MKNKTIISILLFSIIISNIISNVSADDSIYIISGDQVLKQGSYKFIALENITSDILIDSNQIYFYTPNYVYSLNSSSGAVLYKILINSPLEQKLTYNYLYIRGYSNIYTINKSTGEIIQKNKYHQTLDDIFSLSLGTGSTTINNYYVGTNGTDGVNGTDGSDGIDGINGTVDYDLINQSLDTKVNKTGDNMSGILNMTENNISSVNTISITNGINMISKVYNTTYSVNTTATATGVLTINVSNAIGVNNDTLIYLNGHANTNFSDVFFTQNNVVIPFTHTGTNLSVFYINVTTLDYPIFLNYGNLEVNNIGNGNTTFDVYADGTTLEKFNTYGVTLSGGNISIEANASGGNYLTTKTRLERPSVAVYDLIVPTYYGMEGFTNTSGLQSDANLNQITFYAAGDNNLYTEYHDASGISGVNIGSTTTTRHVQSLLWRNSSTDTKFYIDGIQKTSPGANFPTLTSLYFSVSAHNNFNVANIIVDNLLIYKYSNGKFNTWGTETINSVPISGQVYCVFVNAAGSVQSTLGGC